MKPVWHIARNDLRQMLRDGRFRVAAPFTLSLLALAFLLGWREYRQDAARRAESARVVREQWLNQGNKHPHGGAHFGVFVFKSELPLAALDPGLKSYVGALLPLETHARSNFRDRPVEDSTPAVRFGQLTAATVLQLLIPLLIIFLTFGALSGERENGTLQQVLATGVSRAQLVAGKLAGVGGALSLLLLPAAVLGSATLLLGAGGVVRLALLSACYLVYFLIFVLVSLAISARVRGSQTALVLLLACWIGNSLLLPRLASSLAAAVAPTPSTEEFRAALNRSLERGIDGTEEVSARYQTLIKTTLEQYGVSRVEDLPVGYAGVMLKDSDARFESIFDHHFTQLYATYHQQRRLHHAVSFIGPFIAMREISRGLSGMDIAHYDHFARAAEHYRRMFVERTNDIAERGSHGTGWDLEVGRAFWETIPAFEYTLPDWRWAVRQLGLSFGVLSLWLIVAALYAARAFRKLSAV